MFTSAAIGTTAAVASAASTAAAVASYASLAIGAISAVASGVSSYQQNKAQTAYQNAQAEEYVRAANLNNKAAAQEYVEKSSAERIAQMQEKQKADLQTQEVQKEAIQKQGTMLASTNASGMALNAMMADYERQEANRKDIIRQNYEMVDQKADLNISAYRDSAQNKIDSQAGYVKSGSSYSNGMNVFSTTLGIGTSALNAYSNYNAWKYKLNTGTTGQTK